MRGPAWRPDVLVRAGLLWVLVPGVLLVGGCGVGVQQHPVVVAHGRLREPASTTGPGESGGRLVRVFLVRRNQLVDVYRPASPGSGAAAALRALMRPVGHREEAARLRSALPNGGAVPSVKVRAGIAYVGVPGGFSRLGLSEQVLAVGQITDTLTLVDGVTAVQLVHDGRDVDIPVAGGQLVPGPVTAGDYAPVAAEPAARPTTRPRSTTQPGSPSTARSESGSRG